MLTTVLAACCLFSPPALTQDQPVRPRDIWAFRSVLDERARMLTIALHEDLWVAYDATNCGLYKAWTGGVKFDGAVYTTVHGPQPTSEGQAHVLGVVDKPIWVLSRDGAEVPVKAEFKGYETLHNRMKLQYRFRLGGRREVWVYEQPEVRSAGAGRLIFERRFTVTGLGRNEKLGFKALTPGGEWPEGSLHGASFVADSMVSSGMPQPGTIWLQGPSATLSLTIQTGPAGGSQVEANWEQEPGQPRMAGVSLRVYHIGQPLTQMPKLIAGQTPNYSVVIPRVELRKPEQWGPNLDQFYARVTGFLNIRIPGDYQFRLTSDDGSIFSIRDETVINHDGLHGPVPKTGAFRLSEGEHPFVIEFFEEGGGEELLLEWRTPGSAAWEVVPADVFTTPEGEVRVTAPGKKLIFDPNKRSRPGDGRPLEGVHPAFDLETVRPADFRPRVGGMDFLPDGRLVVCTWDPDGAVYVLDGVQAPKPDRITVKRIAAGLAEPLGLKVVGNKIFVLQKQELTRLDDLNGDEVIDRYFAVANGWGVTPNFHEFAFGLLYKDGYFYGNLATAIDPGGRSTQPQNPDRGAVVKINGATGDYTLAAMGLRTPNGIGFGANGDIYITDNQGDWLPSSKLLLYREGAFYGNRSVDPIGKRFTREEPPVAWLPQNEIGNSPSQPAPLNIGPYRNQMIHGDVTHGGVKRVFVETVDGVAQGCVFRFTQGLEAGINRLVWGPDKSLYVGGIGSTGNWGQEGKERFGLQRLRFNGKPVFEMLAVRAMSNGMEVEFTEPVMKGQGASPGDYWVSSWRYEPTAEYGGPKIDERMVPVKTVRFSSNRKRVFLELPEMRAGTVVYIKLNRGIQSSGGRDLWSTEAWYTLNRIPTDRKGIPGHPEPINALTDQERREGFQLLFDGKTADHWRGYRKPAMGSAWKVVDGELRLTPGTGTGGDIITKDKFGDFELRLQWKIEPGGNSGLMYRVSEEFAAPYHTGPEYQILDDDLGADAKNPITSAASNYGLYARTRDVVRPANQWNDTLLIVRGNHVEHWLNGHKVLEYELHSEDWKKRVAASKFAQWPNYGKVAVGHIVLQDHGNRVAYRNIRIRKLEPTRP